MYCTCDGERVLSEPEADLFRHAAWALSDRIVEGPEYTDAFHVGVGIFDRMTRSQKLGMIECVTRALLRPEAAPPKATAVSEGTIGAIFAALKIEVEIELVEQRVHRHNTEADRRYLFYWRRFISDALTYVSRGCFHPVTTHVDLPYWLVCIEELTSMILDGRDYEMEAQYLDAPPRVAARFRRMMGIDRRYFVAIAPDAKEMPRTIHRRIAKLCRARSTESA